MPTKQLYINGRDAFIAWGVALDTQSLSALMAPASVKEVPFNSSRLQHGKRYVDNDIVRIDERNLTLTLNLTAKDETSFFESYKAFVSFLHENPNFTLRTTFQPDIYYRLRYISCSTFSQFMRGIASFALKLVEPDPSNRDVTDAHRNE